MLKEKNNKEHVFCVHRTSPSLHVCMRLGMCLRLRACLLARRVLGLGFILPPRNPMCVGVRFTASLWLSYIHEYSASGEDPRTASLRF